MDRTQLWYKLLNLHARGLLSEADYEAAMKLWRAGDKDSLLTLRIALDAVDPDSRLYRALWKPTLLQRIKQWIYR